MSTAFSCYAVERPPFLKGAAQDKNRINRHLRALGMPTIQVTKAEREINGGKCYWEVSLVREDETEIANSLRAHRAVQAGQTLRSDKIRARLAATKMADV